MWAERVGRLAKDCHKGIFADTDTLIFEYIAGTTVESSHSNLDSGTTKTAVFSYATGFAKKLADAASRQ